MWVLAPRKQIPVNRHLDPSSLPVKLVNVPRTQAVGSAEKPFTPVICRTLVEGPGAAHDLQSTAFRDFQTGDRSTLPISARLDAPLGESSFLAKSDWALSTKVVAKINANEAVSEAVSGSVLIYFHAF